MAEKESWLELILLGYIIHVEMLRVGLTLIITIMITFINNSFADYITFNLLSCTTINDKTDSKSLHLRSWNQQKFDILVEKFQLVAYIITVLFYFKCLID